LLTGWQESERRLEARRAEETEEKALQPLRRGWCLGSEAFKQQLIEHNGGPERGSPLRRFAPGECGSQSRAHSRALFSRMKSSIGLGRINLARMQSPRDLPQTNLN